MDLTILKLVRVTLDSIEVKGKDNLDKLLGCINAVDSLIQVAETASQAASPAPPEDPKPEVDNG